MAKTKDEQPQQTMEDFLLQQLQEEVILKDGTQLKAADGHVMTQKNLAWDVRAPFTQGGGLRRGCGVKTEMTAEEFLEHVKIDGCLTVEGKQYVEMKDVLLLIEMALEQNENALRNCLQIEISEEEFNNAEFDVTDYVNKKIKKAWFVKALEFHTRPFNFPFNNVK